MRLQRKKNNFLEAENEFNEHLHAKLIYINSNLSEKEIRKIIPLKNIFN